MAARRGKCPTCGRAMDLTQPFRPFCSDRCRLADLGKWLDGGYRITSPAAQEDLDQGAADSLNQSLDSDGPPDTGQN